MVGIAAAQQVILSAGRGANLPLYHSLPICQATIFPIYQSTNLPIYHPCTYVSKTSTRYSRPAAAAAK
ncbi:MAG: hypothetical protein V9H69_13210 [Anaerolineae bacterium]